MARIPHVYRRRGGTYALRKRVNFADGVSRPITYSLGTKSPSLARIRAAAACAALEVAIIVVNGITLNGGARSASETSKLIRAALDQELGFAVRDHWFGRDSENEAGNVFFGDYFDLARRYDGQPRLEPEDVQRLEAAGRSARHMAALRGMVRHAQGCNELSDRCLPMHLKAIGYSYDPATSKADRIAMLTGWSQAHYRAAHFHDPSVQASGDPLGYLLEHGHNLVARAATPAPPAESQGQPAEAAQAAQAAQSPSAAGSEPLLSEVVDDVVNDVIARGDWQGKANGTGEDARRLIKQFIWMIGDFPVNAYGQTHITAFEREMRSLPKSVRAQSVWHRPYPEAKVDFPKLTPANTRSGRTMNKDLAYLSTFTTAMETAGYWQAGAIKPLKCSHTVTVKQKSKAKSPWTPAHLGKMFESPIHTGNGGSKRRLKPGSAVYHDAAYWVLALAWFTGARREEICGLLIANIVIEGTTTPHIICCANDLRGLKGDSSERVVPLHPRLIEMGLLEYVEAIRAEGHTALFPELWIYAGKRGGDQYYALVWSKLMEWLRQQPGIAIPTGIAGKAADFHSIRSAVLSQLDRNDINQNIVADIAGHARAGVTAQTYQDLVASGGLDEALRERLEVLKRLPDPTGDVCRTPVRLLPLKLRSR